jgi:hypothetical protein
MCILALMLSKKNTAKKEIPLIIDANVGGPYFQPKKIELNMNIVNQPVIRPQSSYIAPYDVLGFGRDDSRNTDSLDPDVYMNLPLESDGITYNTINKYSSIEEEAGHTPTKFKFIRFTFMEVRDASETIVSLGGIRFFLEHDPIEMDMQIWNPHTGDKEVYDGGEWSDSDQWTVVFIFPEAVEVNRYEFKYSSNAPGMDPIEWKVEGSKNGSYWISLDERSIPKTIRRDRNAEYYMRNLHNVV